MWLCEHEQCHPAGLTADNVLGGDAHVRERQFAAQSCPVAHLVGDRASRDAGLVEVDDEAGEAGRAGVALEVGEHRGEGGDLGVGDESFVAVEDVVIAFTAG